MPREELEELNIKDIKLSPLYYSNDRLNLGDLYGNRFTIKVHADKEPKKLEKIANYFGPQRFGSRRPITHLVGEHVIKDEFEEAVKTYLAKTFETEGDENKKAREELASDWDYKRALKYYPQRLRYERTLLDHLAKNENDFIGALRALPKSLKIMFVHAYQSHLFNEFLKTVQERQLDYETGPLYGYELELENDLEKEILENNHLELSDFRVARMPEMTSSGSRRSLFAPVEDMSITKEDDAYIMRFSLPKGCYATEVIRQAFE
jgi:tRNA pseudouridine13 synthase